jgi:hypothetical protein
MLCDNPELLLRLVREIVGGIIVLALVIGIFGFFWRVMR